MNFTCTYHGRVNPTEFSCGGGENRTRDQSVVRVSTKESYIEVMQDNVLLFSDFPHRFLVRRVFLQVNRRVELCNGLACGFGRRNKPSAICVSQFSICHHAYWGVRNFTRAVERFYDPGTG